MPLASNQSGAPFFGNCNCLRIARVNQVAELDQ